MEKVKSLSAPLKRITVLDALRGFTLLGVILIHMIQHFGIFYSSGGQAVPRFPAMDEAIQWIGQNIIMGRFINVFAFLFGMSFFIQMDRAAKKGIDFRKRFVWRMIILFVIGLIGNSYYSLEIISIYAIFGLALIPLYSAKNWILITITALLLLGTPRIIQSNFHNKTIKEQKAENPTDSNAQRSLAVPENNQNSSFLNSAKQNYTTRLQGKINYQFGMLGRGYVTFALFVFGLIVGRLRFFEDVHIKKKRNVILFAGFIILAILVSMAKGLFPPFHSIILFMPGSELITPSMLIVQALNDINMVLFSGALAMGFIILYQTQFFGKYLDVFSPYGRMGLTNYEMQGLIGSMVFSAWAFGTYFGQCGITELFFLGILIYIVQLFISKIWLKHFLYGPLEWAWRSATYLKFQPFRKKNIIQ